MHNYLKFMLSLGFTLLLPAQAVYSAKAEQPEKERLRFTLVQIDKRAYLSLANLKRVHDDLQARYDKAEGQGELRYKKRVILFRLDESE